MYSDCFHEKVAASPKPKEGQHSNPLFNTKRSHKTIRSPPHVLKQVKNTAWRVFEAISRFQNS
uniref:Uncharacterized protein n=1 Tax=Lepeophtheirus salmonis TaxID=72036 RepID=A0A0K2VKZ5_LEPSM